MVTESDILVYHATTICNVKETLTPESLKQAQKNSFDAILQHSTDFIFFKNSHHVFTIISQSIADITGLKDVNEHIGLTDYDLFPKRYADNFYRLEKELYRGRCSFIEEVQPFLDENGHEGWIDSKKYPIKDKSGKVIGLFGVARIITEEVIRKKESEEREQKLALLANYDSLTSLFNRRYGTILCERAFEEARRCDHEFSLILFDIDHFKKVNDLYGHEAGDQALICIANTIGGLIRSTDTLLRYGGEEFIICMPQSNLSAAIKLSQRISSTLANTKVDSINGWLSVSGGVVQLSDEENLHSLICKADDLLYIAKREGRNCFRYEDCYEI